MTLYLYLHVVTSTYTSTSTCSHHLIPLPPHGHITLYLYLHMLTSPYTSTSTCSHHLIPLPPRGHITLPLPPRAHITCCTTNHIRREHSFCLIHYVQPTETCICYTTFHDKHLAMTDWPLFYLKPSELFTREPTSK